MYLTHHFPDKYYNELERILKESRINYFISYLEKKDEKKDMFKGIEKTKYVYVTRIDSDDLFHKEVVEEIQQHDFSWRRALIYQYGYCFDCVNKRMRYHYVPCPPFSTIIYPTEIYIDKDPSRISKYVNTISGHDQLLRSMNSLPLSKYKYIVLCHKMNDSTYYTERKEEHLKTIDKKLHNNILLDFNISTKTYEKIV